MQYNTYYNSMLDLSIFSFCEFRPEFWTKAGAHAHPRCWDFGVIHATNAQV
jgi:hypothetical protein